jgi:hypothetical protein
MNNTPSVLRLEREIDALRRKLLALGPLHPGSISRQYHVCGNPRCCCMHPQHPHRHGPYHKLAYVHRGRPVCRFVRADCVQEIQKRLANYKGFRGIIDRWIALSIQRGMNEFFNRPSVAKTAGRSNRPGRGQARSRRSKPK